MFVRLNLALIGLGALLGWVGYDEVKVSEEASPQAQQVELAALEAGQIPDNTHLEIGPHWRMYQELVFRYELDRGQTEEDLADGTKVDYSYFPILSHTRSAKARGSAIIASNCTSVAIDATRRKPCSLMFRQWYAH